MLIREQVMESLDTILVHERLFGKRKNPGRKLIGSVSS
jgi:hypothetical protein